MNAQLASRFTRTNGSIRSDNPLSNEQLIRVVPSVFAESAHESRSSRYTYIPTIEIVEGLRQEGFFPFSAAQARTRIEGREDFVRHMLRFRRDNAISADVADEIVLLNSHDGCSSYQMLSGCFRFVCCNGMVCGDIGQDIRIRHSGRHIVDDCIEGAYTILKCFDELRDSREAMKAIELRPEHQMAFAQAALELRYDADEHRPIEPHQLLAVRRIADRPNNLWTTFNRVQENMLKGGLHGHASTGRRTTTRQVQSITENVRLNRALWMLAESMRFMLE